METRLNRFLRTRPLAALSGTIVLGTAAGLSAGEIPFFLICGAVFAAIAAALCVLRQPNRFAAWLCVVLFASAALSDWRTQRPEAETVFAADVTGVVCDSPEWQADKARTVYHIDDVTVNGERIEHRLRVYAYGESAMPATLADRVSMRTSVFEPSRGGNGTFDFRQMLWAEGVTGFVSLEASEIAVVPENGGFMEKMSQWRDSLRRRTDALFPENAAILKGLMLGDRTDIADEDETAFAQSGILHLLAVSGLHVSILASAITAVGVALCIPKAVMLVCVTALLVLYALLCGGSPSIVRAVLMYLVLQGGGLAKRSGDSLTRLGTACAAMVLYDPKMLWQTGFQLSFAAVAGLTLLLPTMTQLRDRGPALIKSGAGRYLTDALLVSIAVQLSALPVMIGAFGEVSWVSLLLNLPCIPLAQAALMLGLASLLGSCLFPVGLLAAAADGLTGILLKIAQWGASLPCAVVQIPKMLLPFVIAYVICMAVGAAQIKTKLRTRVIAMLMLPVLVLGSGAVSRYLVASEDFQVTFLDVGQGDSSLINADGKLYLVDVGPDSSAAEYLSAHQLDVEGIFLSHAHDDHAGGLSEVLAVTQPEWICLPKGHYGGEAEIASLIEIAQAEESGIKVRILSAGDEIPLSDEITARVLYPEEGMELSGGNESSMVLRVEYGEGSVLFTGDLPAESEVFSVEPCSVLKVAHHGSAHSTSSRFLALAKPALAVISVGEMNSYGHPAPELLERLENLGCRVLRTDENGAIAVEIDRNGDVRVKSYYSE